MDNTGTSFLAVLRHKPIRASRQRVRGAETCKTPSAPSPGGMPEEPGEEGQCTSLVGKCYHTLRAARTPGWERGGFEGPNREGKPAPGGAGQRSRVRGAGEVRSSRRQGRAGWRRPGSPPAPAGERRPRRRGQPLPSLPARPRGEPLPVQGQPWARRADPPAPYRATSHLRLG